MYIDDLLKYKCVCLGYISKTEPLVDQILINISEYFGDKCTMVYDDRLRNNLPINDIYVFMNEIDIDYIKSKDFYRIMQIHYPNSTFIIKKGMYVPMPSNIHVINQMPTYSISPNMLLYGADLCISFTDNISVIKDRYDNFQGKNLNNMFNVSKSAIRCLKIKNIKEKHGRHSI